MKKPLIALAVSISMLVASRPAEAGCGGQCPRWVEVLGAAFGVGLVGAYAGGTGYFIYRDATGERQDLEYLGTELGVNAAFGALWGIGTVAAIQERKPGQVAVFGGLALIHGALAVHGAAGIWEQRSKLYLSDETWLGIGGIAFATNAVLWATQLGEPHGRGFGIAEAAVNLPLAAGLGYVAVQRARDGDGKPAILLGGLAAIAGALTYHGVRTAISPTRRPVLRALGADFMPTMVGDGTERAPGLGAFGTW